MAEQATLSRFCVEGLRGQRTIDAKIKDNTLVIVGENGSGKTTFLRLMFYFLSGRWASLVQFKFVRIVATINGHDFVLDYKDLESYTFYDADMLRRLPPSLRRRFREAEESGRWEEVQSLMAAYFGRSNQPSLLNNGSLETLMKLQSQITEAMGSQILYLPTFRRIERELSSIFQGVDIEELRRKGVTDQSETGDSYIELVEFGMVDVEKNISDALERIRSFANSGLNSLTMSYLGDVVGQNYLPAALFEIQKVSEEVITEVLNRISSTILKDAQKANLRDIIMSAKERRTVPTEHQQMVLHYFSKLLKFQSELQERESNIRAFCDLCSDYITDKMFVYDAAHFSFRIDWTGKKKSSKKTLSDLANNKIDSGDVRLSDLSSGEKQIVSLFSHLYLSGRSKYFVLIDEPELSLSVPWQRRFLEDIRGGSFCSGLVAVTHSPFIYDNSLRRRTQALGEFIHSADWGRIS